MAGPDRSLVVFSGIGHPYQAFSLAVNVSLSPPSIGQGPSILDISCWRRLSQPSFETYWSSSRVCRKAATGPFGSAIESQWQSLERPHESNIAPTEFFCGYGKTHVPQALQKQIECNLRLHARQCGTETKMNALAKREMSIRPGFSIAPA